jgi:hypothetical protein
MTGEQELVALLYRADWARLSLSGRVRGIDESTFSTLTVTEGRRPKRGEPFPPPFPPFSFAPGQEPGAAELAVQVAPGKRYREESPDGRQVRGCDGERIWLWVADPAAGTEVRLAGRPQPPFPVLLAPFWLLGGYQLSIEGEATACGRAGVRVVATPRPDVRRREGWDWRDGFDGLDGLEGLERRVGWGGRGGRGWPLIPPLRWSSFTRFDRVACVVDAELGILLRCECVRGDRSPSVTEFVQLSLDPETDRERFSAPEGSIIGEGPESAWTFFTPGGGVRREAVKTAAGLAAGGLGAAIRYSRNPFGLFGQSRRAWAPDDDPDAAMPYDGDPVVSSPPAPPSSDAARNPWATAAAEAEAAAGVTDEMLHLLYRGGAGNPQFSGTLHRWFDFGALLDAVPDVARKVGFGGVGFLVDTLKDVARGAGPSVEHTVRSVRMDGWDRYRIDLTYQTPSAREHDRGEAGPDDDEPGGVGDGNVDGSDSSSGQPDGSDADRGEPGGSDAESGGPDESDAESGQPDGLDAESGEPDGSDSADRDLDDEDVYGRHDVPLTVACDGQRRWQVFADHVVVGPPGPPPDEIFDLLDGSWLLGCELSDGEEIVVGGRRAYRLRATDRHQPWFAHAAFSGYYFPLVAVVDAESGRLLRITWYKGGKPVSRHEFRDVVAGGDGDFGFEVPAGLRVVTESAHTAGSKSAGSESAGSGKAGPAGSGWRRADESTAENPMGYIAKAAADAVKKQVDEKAAAARAFLDSLSGRKPPPPTR